MLVCLKPQLICRFPSANFIFRCCASNSSSEPLVVSKKYRNITLLGLNRPSQKNAVNIQMIDELIVALEDFENDDSSNVGLLYGEGGNFCSGYDLKELASEEHSQILLSKKLTESYLKKPLVAAVSGYGIGFGFDLALWCDLRIMEHTALIGFYGRRFGIPISEWTIKRLESSIGLTRTMDLLCTGRGLSSSEAQKWGLINGETECGTAIGQAFSLANCVAKFPQPSLLADRAKAYSVSYDGQKELLKAVELEIDRNTSITLKNLNDGANLFLKGMGRHGKFSTKVPEED